MTKNEYIPTKCYEPYQAYARYIQSLYKVSYFEKRIQNFKNSKILDFGCGSGALVATINDHYPNIDISGFDNRPEAIEDCSNTLFPRIKSKIFNDRKFLETYEIIISQYVSAYINHDKFFEELNELLFPKGFLIIETTKSDLISFLQRIDYRIWKISKESYSKWFELIEKRSSLITNRTFDFTQKSYSKVRMKFLLDSVMSVFNQTDSELLILRKK